MGWLIAGLLVLVLLGGLVAFIRGRGRSRPSADDTLVTDLLGPPDQPTVPAPLVQRRGAPAPAAQVPKEVEHSPVAKVREDSRPSRAAKAREDGETPAAAQVRENREPPPAVQAREDGEPWPTLPAPSAGDGDWLETHLAWINAWSQRMSQQITSAEQPEPHGKE